MKQICIFLMAIFLLSCSKDKETSGSQVVREVEVHNKSNYVFKKIYIVDHNGYTHEILTATTGSTLGGIEMLELCSYKEK